MRLENFCLELEISGYSTGTKQNKALLLSSAYCHYAHNSVGFTMRDQIKGQLQTAMTRSRQQHDKAENPRSTTLFLLCFTTGTCLIQKNTKRFTRKLFTTPNNLECMRASTLAHVRIFRNILMFLSHRDKRIRIFKAGVCALVFLKSPWVNLVLKTTKVWNTKQNT